MLLLGHITLSKSTQGPTRRFRQLRSHKIRRPRHWNVLQERDFHVCCKSAFGLRHQLIALDWYSRVPRTLALPHVELLLRRHHFPNRKGLAN